MPELFGKHQALLRYGNAKGETFSGPTRYYAGRPVPRDGSMTLAIVWAMKQQGYSMQRARAELEDTHNLGGRWFRDLSDDYKRDLMLVDLWAWADEADPIGSHRPELPKEVVIKAPEEATFSHCSPPRRGITMREKQLPTNYTITILPPVMFTLLTFIEANPETLSTTADKALALHSKGHWKAMGQAYRRAALSRRLIREVPSKGPAKPLKITPKGQRWVKDYVDGVLSWLTEPEPAPSGPPLPNSSDHVDLDDVLKLITTPTSAVVSLDDVLWLPPHSSPDS